MRSGSPFLSLNHFRLTFFAAEPFPRFFAVRRDWWSDGALRLSVAPRHLGRCLLRGRGRGRARRLSTLLRSLQGLVERRRPLIERARRRLPERAVQHADADALGGDFQSVLSRISSVTAPLPGLTHVLPVDGRPGLGSHASPHPRKPPSEATLSAQDPPGGPHSRPSFDGAGEIDVGDSSRASAGENFGRPFRLHVD